MSRTDSTRIRAEIASIRERLDELEALVGPAGPAWDPDRDGYPEYCDWQCSSCRGDPCKYPGECWEPYCLDRLKVYEAREERRKRKRVEQAPQRRRGQRS